MILSKKTREKLRTGRIIILIALDLDISIDSFRRWIRTNSSRLTELKTIDSICKHTGLEASEIFETEKVK